jgi:GNAT superfamily N-acetyltransferase
MGEIMFEVFDEVPEAAETFIDDALTHYNNDMLGGPSGRKRLFIPLYDPSGELDGGLVGHTGRQWLYVAMLFVPERLRGQGVASQLLTAAEDEARERGCKASFLDTINPVARSLYQKHGYTVIGALEDFVEGYSVTWMTKML